MTKSSTVRRKRFPAAAAAVRLIAIAAAGPLTVAAVAVADRPAHAQDGKKVRTVAAAGHASLHPVAPGTGDISKPEIDPAPSKAGGRKKSRPQGGAPIDIRAGKAAAGRRSSHPVAALRGRSAARKSQATSAGPKLVASFDGLTERDQRVANHGNQFTLEPPDQGLCAGNGFVLESVNGALTAYSQSGSRLVGSTDLNTFYGYAPAIVRGSTDVFGPMVTDPSCYFDPDTQRWFQVALTLDRVGATAADSGANHLDLAVSSTASPLGGWIVYRLDVTDDGSNGTPDHHCTAGAGAPASHPHACLGDFPHIGADRNGIFLTTNEYSFFGSEFHSANVYVFSKRALAAQQKGVPVTQFETPGAVQAGTVREAGFSVWPAISSDGQYADASGGTEYFLSSDAAEEVNRTATSDRLVFWSISNTGSLNGVPDLHLTNRVLAVKPYAVPALSSQKAGSFPLGQCINDTTMPTPLGPGCWRLLGLATEPAHNEVEASLDSSDSRILSVTHAAGRLWADLDTGLGPSGEAGIEWFTVKPNAAAGGAPLASSDYLFQPGESLTYGTIGITSSGQGVMGFTMLGASHFPSAGYASIGFDGVHSVRIVAEGAGPSDGFTDYKAFSAPDPLRSRWGDYGAAVATGNNVWLASEYIGQTCDLATYASVSSFGSCSGSRTGLANWDTRISHFTV